MTQELNHSRLENASLQAKLQLAAPAPGTITTMAHPPQCLPGPEDFREGTGSLMDDAVDRRNGQPQQCMGMGSQYSNSLVVGGQICAPGMYIYIFILTYLRLIISCSSRTANFSRSRHVLHVPEF